MLQLRGTLCAKSFIVALAALAATASFAQSSVEIWGVVDAGVQSAKQNGVSKTQLSSSGLSSSQLGFRGVEDLGGGLKAGFWLEGALTNDEGTSGALKFGRRSTLDLAGNFGAVRLGRDYVPTFWNHTVFDPFGTLGSGAGSNITGRGTNATTGARSNNGVSYLYGFAPNAGSALGSGVYAQATYAFAETLSTAAAKTNEYQGIRVGYAAGPLNVALATGSVVSSATAKDKETNIGASYDMGVAQLMAKVGTNTLGTAIAATAASGNNAAIPGVAAAKYSWTSIGAKIPMGAGYIPVSFNTSKNDADTAKATQMAIGYVHNLSKRTAAYGTYSKISNKNGATYGFNGGNGGFGSGLAPTGDGTAFDIGLRHTF